VQRVISALGYVEERTFGSRTPSPRIVEGLNLSIGALATGRLEKN
jgi:hypothetical protein